MPCQRVLGQKAADTSAEGNKAGSNIFAFALNAIKRNPGDSVVIKTKGEDPFLPYQGKIIRRIIFREFGFEQNFTDTAGKIDYFGTNLLNQLHKKTQVWVLRDNLLLRENTPLDAYKVADNERYYRSLEFMQDARILVRAIPNQQDSVDLVVVTKDLFSLTGTINNFTPGDYQFGVADVNILGMGQKVAAGVVIQNNRSPNVGFSALYSKNNVAHSFVNASIGYSTIAPDLKDNTPDEQAAFLALQMPLVSQYAHFAGGFLLSANKNNNTYARPGPSFYQYSYHTMDAWVGYNLDADRYEQNRMLKDKHFIALRYFNTRFAQTPMQTNGRYNFRFDDKQALLAQVTFFRQVFFKTNYIYGFGNTEDIPTGYNLAVVGGWFKQREMSRPYFGINANCYTVNNHGAFTQYYIRSGTFYNGGQLQDVSLLLGAGYFSKVLVWNNIKIRQYINVSFTKMYNRVGLDPLNINNVFGLRSFNADSLVGTRRISLYSETFSFLKYKMFGFKFAPFAVGDASILTPEHRDFSSSGFFYGIGGGIRTRNENFVFGTIELRCIYFPRNVKGNNAFKLTITTNLNFRYNSQYVTAPDIVQSNTDNNNGIY